MKVIIVALAFVAAAAAAALENEVPQIRSSNYDQSPEGGYNFGFDTENGINRQEQGVLKTVPNEENQPQDVIVVKGSYSYTDPEGNVVTINYEGDENGFRAEGPSIPKGPAVSRR